MSAAAPLQISDLTIGFPGADDALVPVVQGVSLNVERGEIVGLVGESGAGKSMVALAALGLIPAPGGLSGGQIQLGGTEITQLPEHALLKIRGKRIGIIFQDPLSALNPLRAVSAPLIESARRHQQISRRAAVALVAEALDAVGIDNAAQRLNDYPHEFSGGQRQRIMIALALINEPDILIADEPTTALDATVQAQILDLLQSRTRTGGLLIITHDLAMASAYCDRICVMRAGRIVDEGPPGSVIDKPGHDYTRRLVESMPKISRPGSPQANTGSLPAPQSHAGMTPVLRVTDLDVRYGTGRREFLAVENVSFAINPSETVGLVGESGSGKSSVARAIVGLLNQHDGDIEMPGLATKDSRSRARHVQMIFQDPAASLDPRWDVSRILSEAFEALGDTPDVNPTEIRQTAISAALASVSLDDTALPRRPSEFSGGERQRICIARSLIPEPKLIVADEALASLDMSVQKQILDLLSKLQKKHGLAALFITHDLSVVANQTDRLLVMYRGRIVESGPTRAVVEHPLHPYTAGLLASVPGLVAESKRKELLAPNREETDDLPGGCAFAARCPLATDLCERQEPAAPDAGIEHGAACHRPGEVDLWNNSA